MSKNVEDRISLIESRLSMIESQLNKPTKVIKKPVDDFGFDFNDKVAAPSRLGQNIAASEKKPGNWLGVISVICFVLAAGFIIKLSIDSGWLTPARQIGLAILLGIGLVGSGIGLATSDRAYSCFLSGAGITILYLTVFASHNFYSLISFELAILIIGCVSIICIWLYTQIEHDIFPIIASIGAYLSPLILGVSKDAEFSLYYFLVCSIALAFISILVKSRTLTLISSYLAILMSALIGFKINNDILVATILALQFFVFAFGTYLYTSRNQLPLSETEAWSFLPVLLAFYAMEYYFLERINPGFAPLISLGFAAVLIGFYLSAKIYFPDNLGSQSLVLSFTSIVIFHSLYLELLPDNIKHWLFVLIMICIALSPFDLNATNQKDSPFKIPLLTILAILAIEYLTMVFHLFRSTESLLGVSAAAFASIWFVIINKRNAKGETTFGHGLLIAAHLLAIIGLYRFTKDISSLAVSATWLFYAACVMVYAFKLSDEVMAKSALFVLTFSAAKALLYDASTAPTVMRIACLLLTGIVLYACGFLMRQIDTWKN